MDRVHFFRFTVFLFNFPAVRLLTNPPTLYQDMMDGYEKHLMPNWKRQGVDKFKLQVNIIPGFLSKFDEINEEIKMFLTMQLNWTDSRLAWNATAHDNQYLVIITPEDIWLPYLYLTNDVVDSKPVGYDSSYYAIVTNGGMVFWFPNGQFNSHCTPNVFRFPFDTQKCHYVFQMIGLPLTEVEYKLLSNKPDMTYFESYSDWKVVDIKQDINKELPQVVLEISIKRQPMYYIVTVILPTIMFALMNPLVFCLPVESGERVSLGMTILLAYVIFLTIVSTSIPVKSDPFCAVILVLVLIMVVSILVVIFSIINVRYYFKGEVDDVCSCLKRLAAKYQKKKHSLKDAFDLESLADITGKDIAHALDKVFCILSYFLFTGILSSYLILILSSHID